MSDVLRKADGENPVRAFTEYSAIKEKISHVLVLMVDIENEKGTNSHRGPLFRYLGERRRELYQQLDDLEIKKRKAS